MSDLTIEKMREFRLKIKEFEIHDKQLKVIIGNHELYADGLKRMKELNESEGADG